MATNYTEHFNTKKTPQSEPIPGKVMVQNNAGGYSFEVTPWTRLDRFLILGSASNTYYQTAPALTRENAKTVEALIKTDGLGVVARTAAISDQGRAPKNDPAEFVLAMCAAFGDAGTRTAAFAALPKVCRIGTHLFHFVRNYEALGGKWNRSSRRGLAEWYTSKSADQLAYQLSKYQSRDGWSHRDLLRLAHPRFGQGKDGLSGTQDQHRNAVARWATRGLEGLAGQTAKEGSKRPTLSTISEGYLPRLLEGFEKAKLSASAKETAKLITEYNLPRECVKTEHLNDPAVWDVLLPKMGLEALIRNLNKMTIVGLIKPLSSTLKMIKEKLSSIEELKKARLHPLKILTAGLRYKTGHGDRGKLAWNPVSQVDDILEDAFYLSFDAAEPMNQNVMVALDVSGSMGSGEVGGVHGLIPCMVGAALSLLMAKREPNYYVHGFSGNFIDLGITAKDSLPTAMEKAIKHNFGGTDASIPMTYATKNKLDVDMFIVITDGETWAGDIHPTQALREYRKTSGRPAKLATMTLTPTGHSMVESNDTGALDICGFDTAVPNLLYDFATNGNGTGPTSAEDDA